MKGGVMKKLFIMVLVIALGTFAFAAGTAEAEGDALVDVRVAIHANEGGESLESCLKQLNL